MLSFSSIQEIMEYVIIAVLVWNDQILIKQF